MRSRCARCRRRPRWTCPYKGRCRGGGSATGRQCSAPQPPPDGVSKAARRASPSWRAAARRVVASWRVAVAPLDRPPSCPCPVPPHTARQRSCGAAPTACLRLIDGCAPPPPPDHPPSGRGRLRLASRRSHIAARGPARGHRRSQCCALTSRCSLRRRRRRRRRRCCRRRRRRRRRPPRRTTRRTQDRWRPTARARPRPPPGKRTPAWCRRWSRLRGGPPLSRCTRRPAGGRSSRNARRMPRAAAVAAPS